MNSRATIAFICILLTVSGLAIAITRHVQTGIPWFPGERTTVWLVEARIDFQPSGGPIAVSLSVPESIPGYRIVDEQAAAAGYGFAIVTEDGARYVLELDECREDQPVALVEEVLGIQHLDFKMIDTGLQPRHTIDQPG